jgi:hypothetical protein
VAAEVVDPHEARVNVVARAASAFGALIESRDLAEARTCPGSERRLGGALGEAWMETREELLAAIEARLRQAAAGGSGSGLSAGGSRRRASAGRHAGRKRQGPACALPAAGRRSGLAAGGRADGSSVLRRTFDGWVVSVRNGGWDAMADGIALFRRHGGGRAVVANIIVDSSGDGARSQVGDYDFKDGLSLRQASDVLARLAAIGFDDAVINRAGGDLEELEAVRSLV